MAKESMVKTISFLILIIAIFGFSFGFYSIGGADNVALILFFFGIILSIFFAIHAMANKK